jgi:tetratricopeptide (TPR) repeat protein
MRILTLILGSTLAFYCSAAILAESLWQNSQSANHVLCRFLLCANEPLVDQARQQMASVEGEAAQKAVATLKLVLQRDPQNPYHWAELGDAFLEAGQDENARYCFDRVQALAPNSADLLLRSANFHLQVGETTKALHITARILTLTADYEEVIFSEYTRLVDHVEDVLRFGLPEDRRAAEAWLRFLTDAGRIGDAQHTWDWVAERGYADDTLAGEYVEFLVRQGRPEWAASAWSRHLGNRSGDYRQSNYLFNGDLESEPARSPFDWNLASAQGAEVTRDCTTARMGECSLRIKFAGTRNLDFAAASQITFVPPGPYRFHALIRTEGLTTDQGIRFRISDDEVPARLDVTFGHFMGTWTWSSVEQDIVVPPASRLLQVRIIRQPSLRFDNKVDGTAWFDDLRLEPIGNRSSR